MEPRTSTVSSSMLGPQRTPGRASRNCHRGGRARRPPPPPAGPRLRPLLLLRAGRHRRSGAERGGAGLPAAGGAGRSLRERRQGRAPRRYLSARRRGAELEAAGRGRGRVRGAAGAACGDNAVRAGPRLAMNAAQKAAPEGAPSAPEPPPGAVKMVPGIQRPARLCPSRSALPRPAHTPPGLPCPPPFPVRCCRQKQ